MFPDQRCAARPGDIAGRRLHVHSRAFLNRREGVAANKVHVTIRHRLRPLQSRCGSNDGDLRRTVGQGRRPKSAKKLDPGVASPNTRRVTTLAASGVAGVSFRTLWQEGGSDVVDAVGVIVGGVVFLSGFFAGTRLVAVVLERRERSLPGSARPLTRPGDGCGCGPVSTGTRASPIFGTRNRNCDRQVFCVVEVNLVVTPIG